MKMLLVLLAACLMTSFASALTAQDCDNQLAQCVSNMCTQAGCSLSGTQCFCSSAQETQWDSLIDANCQAPYLSCTQQVSGSSPGTGVTPGGGCCGSGFVLLLGAAGILLARHS